ncbi:MAG: c-di-GMP-related signal transduction protein [Myxococcota bacterium]|jgi:c-di-GMP-related signal transduction protein
MNNDPQIFVGRQPILDREQKLVAYELLFRGSQHASTAEFAEQGAASLRVIVNAFMTMGLDRVLGESLGFFNVVGAMIMSDLIEALPRERVVIEVLEDVVVDDELRVRCIELKEKGFTLALDDWVRDDPREEILDLADYVKVDLMAIPRKSWRTVVRKLRKRDVILLAEKVETVEDFEFCMELGFDLFQGYFFAVPQVLASGSVDPAQLVVLDLIQKLIADVENEVLVEILKHNPTLSVNLLRLVNSASMALASKIGRVEDAVVYLGRENLRRWLFMLLYVGESDEGMQHPLLLAATHRGRLMELISNELIESSQDSPQAEGAFLVGMLSLVDALISRPIEEILPELNLAEDVEAALLKGTGVLGQLLELVKCVERADFDALDHGLAALGIDVATLQSCENRAYAWVHGLSQQAGAVPDSPAK